MNMKDTLNSYTFVRRYLSDNEIYQIFEQLEKRGVGEHKWAGKVVDVVYRKLQKIRSFWFNFYYKYQILSISLLTFSITFSKKFISSSSFCSLFFRESCTAWCILLYSLSNRSTILDYSTSFSFRYSPIISVNYWICELYWANIFFVISWVEVSSASISASRAFMEVSILLNSLIENLQEETLLVLAEVSSIRQASRLVFTFFSVYRRYLASLSMALCAFFYARAILILLVSSK